MKYRPALALAVALFGIAAAPMGDMAATANGFYSVYAGFHPSDGIPDASARARLASFLSDRLDSQLAAAARAEASFSAAHKNAPPLLEGDLFSSLFEGASELPLVASCTGDSKAGKCSVALHHADPNGKPVDWTDTLVLVNGPKGWRVDDIVYGGNFSFGNNGTLSDTLKTAQALVH